jgi:uncharacterized membrane protein YgcG
VDEQHSAAAPGDDAPDAKVPDERPASRRFVRRDTIALAGLVMATVVVFGGIAWDAGWIGPGDGIPASRTTSPVTGATTEPAAGAPGRAGTAPRAGQPAPPTNGGSGAKSGHGGRNGSGAGSASSGGGLTQGEAARRAALSPAPRPPATPGISQDELDRRRNAIEATVPVATASMAVPGPSTTP